MLPSRQIKKKMEDKAKLRKVLGEVQLEGKHGKEHISNLASPVNKRLSEALNDQRSLKEQFNSTAQQLIKREQTIDELKTKISQKNGTMEKLDAEKCKLLGEVKQLSLEKEQLHSLVQEEQEVRNMIQVESQKLITDIKMSYEHKISKLRDEIRTKEEVVAIKQDLITEMESLVKKLRKEIISLNSELKKARSQEREVQGKMSQNYRGSISMMQSQLSEKSQELENQIKEMEIQHAKEIEARCLECETIESELRKKFQETNSLLKKKDEEIDEKTLQIQYLQKNLAALKEDKSEDLENQIEELKANHMEEMENKCSEIEIIESKLKKKLQDANAMLKRKDEEIAEKTRKIGSLPTNLFVHQEAKAQKLENQIKDMEAQHLKEIEKKYTRFEKIESELRNKLQETNSLLKKKEDEITENNRKIGSLQTNFDQKEAKVQELENQIKEMKSKHLKEVEKKCSEFETFELEMKKKLQETTPLLKKKDDEIAEKARKITSLEKNVAVLKEALTVLDNQLTDFELAFDSKNKELAVSEEFKEKISLECSSLKESLQKAKIDLNEANSLKAFLERRLKEVESNMKQKTEQSTETVSSLQLTMEEYKTKNAELLSNSNKLAAEFEIVTGEKEYLKTRFNEVNSDNFKLTQELHKCLDSVYELKNKVIELEEEIKETKEAAESHISKLDKLYVTTLHAKDASNIQMQGTISQQAKLIQFLQDQNEALTKKKKFNFFSRDKEASTPTPTPTSSKKGVTLPRMMETPKTTKATPKNQRLPLNEKQKSAGALTLRKCEEKALLAELNEINSEPHESHDANNGGIVRKSLILKDEKHQFDVNCAFHIVDDLYLLGCDQGLFSRKGEGNHTSVVKIEGMLAVYQMEFVSSLNAVLFIEGTDQNLMLASMGIVRSCAEAAECSQPRMNGKMVSDVRNCHMFQVRDVNLRDLTVCVTTQKHIHILSWKESSFVLRQKISTSEVVTCMLMTPSSVIYGSGKVYELDTKNYQLQEFLDETDPSLYFVIFGSDDLTIPMAIIDVGMSNWTPNKRSYTKEYLICYPTLGIFVDEDGHRTRGEDIAWQKFPQSINYRHPNLYIFHHSSVEIIRINFESYTKTRVEVTKDSVGKEVSNFPSSSFCQLSSPRYLGRGAKTASIVLSSRDKHKTELYDVDLQVEAHSSNNEIKPSISTQLDFTMSDSELET